MRVALLVQNNYILYLTIPVARWCWSNPEVTLVDRSGGSEFNADDCGVQWADFDVVIPYGSVQMVRQLLNTGVAQWVHYSVDARWATDFWIDQFGHLACNHNGQLMLAGEVSDFLAEHGPQHVRPNNYDKAFTAAVFPTPDSWRSMDKPVDGSLPCFVSPLVTIEAEYRCWVVGDKVVEMSQYMDRGQYLKQRIDPSDPLWHSAQLLTEVFMPADCCVMDVAVVDGVVKFLEFNSIHSSGWYAADINTVLRALVDWSVSKCS